MSTSESAWPDYELVDFGAGRRLERFGEWLLDRPCPAAAAIAQFNPAAWSEATARFDGQRAAAGAWRPPAAKWGRQELPFAAPLVEGVELRFALEPLPSGQIGVFPEQFVNWQWIARQTRTAIAADRPSVRVLNLFAYTGGSTLAAAAMGAEVVHVDAARSVVARARDNAAASGLADAPIRWIVEDALKFCQREVKRGNRYDAVVLDPPSYGHGPQGQQWRVDRDLLPLLELCGELVERRPRYLLVTCHTPGVGQAELSAMLADGVFGHCGQPPHTGELTLRTPAGRSLPSGVFARWPR
ncbi:MAG: class I SAM-dependent methyltransferase [Pirellulales bacterium]|nr:class I SAM-dependent methyltransferase [Pirellulales bacterium]